MRIFTGRTGAFLCLLVGLVCFPLLSVFAEGESAGDTGTGSGSTPDLGLGVFSRFPLNISASVHGGYDDNINTAHDMKQDSWFTTAGLAVGYELGNTRTKLTLSSNFGFTYYTSNDSSGGFEPNINLTLALRHKVSPRFDLAFSGNVVYQTEPDFQYGLGTNRRAGNYFFTQDRITANYIWAPRFATATSYGFTAVHYDDMAAGFFEDRVENTIGNEFRFLIWPTTNVVAEYRFQVVSYAHINRDSTTNIILAGFDHAFSARLSAAFRGGAEFRHYEDTGSQNSPYFESTVTYKLGKDTALAWDAHYGIEEGDVATNPTRTTFRTGLQGRHNLTPRISASLSMYYLHDDYDQSVVMTPGFLPIVNPGFTEDSFSIDLALRYAITRYLGIEAGYDHTEVSSGQILRDYSRNRVWGGINVAF